MEERFIKVKEAIDQISELVTPENLIDPNKRTIVQVAGVTALTAALLTIKEIQEEEEKRKRKKRKARRRAERSCWVHPYLQRRLEQGHYDNLMHELATETPELFKNYTRTTPSLFDEIVTRVTPLIEKEETYFRKPLPPGLRVAITLRFLATGESYMSLQYSFRVAHNSISMLVPETCRAIASVFGPEELKVPESVEEWKEIAKGFENRWNMPHCTGAVDGKHIRIRNPANGGSKYFNYKKFFSIVLLGVVDSEYRFIYVDIGAIGSESDAGIFAQTRLRNLIEQQAVNFPPPEPLSGDDDGEPLDYFFVGDDAFPLRPYLMKPYPARALNNQERIFNYRLSRARRTVENAFGILANRFRVFHTSICLNHDNLEAIVMGACVLHNMLRTRNVISNQLTDSEDPSTHETINGSWRADPSLGQPLPNSHGRGGRNNTNRAVHQRHRLREYVNSEAGAVPWQNRMI